MGQVQAGKLDAGRATQSKAVTEPGWVADARELNAALPGTLAGLVSQQGAELSGLKEEAGRIRLFAAYPTLDGGQASIQAEGVTASSVALVNCVQGNGLYVTGATCLDGCIKFWVNNADASGIIACNVALRI